MGAQTNENVTTVFKENGTLILGDNNSSADIFLSGGTDNKQWGITTGSTPNPDNNGVDESLQIGMNIPYTDGYQSQFNTLKLEFETNYKDLQNNIEYDEMYFQWKRASTGLYYRQWAASFNEFNGIPKLEASIIGNVQFKPTTDLTNYSSTPSNLYIEDAIDGKILIGANPDLAQSKLEIYSNDFNAPTMRIGSGLSKPTLGFYNYSSVSGLQPTYAKIELQNVSATADEETGRLHFKLRKNGIENTKFTMHENGMFGIGIVPTKALHIIDPNFVNGSVSNTLALEADGFGSAVGDGLRIGFGPKNSASYPLGIFAKVTQSSYNIGFDFYGDPKFTYNINANELEVVGDLKTGSFRFNVQYPINGDGVPNGSMFYGVDGALYFKGGSGTVTMIAPD